MTLAVLLLFAGSLMAGELSWPSWRKDRNLSGTAIVKRLPTSATEVARYPVGGNALNDREVWLGNDGDGARFALYISGGRLIRLASDGSKVWAAAPAGLSEIIDVSDLDADGDLDVTCSSYRYKSPGSISIFSFDTGEIEFRFSFSGAEGGLNRGTTTVVSLDGRTRMIFALQTWSNHLWAFRFDEGVAKGKLAWKSDAMHYNSSHVAPVVWDVGRNGEQKVIVDCGGVLYVFDARTGAKRQALSYHDNVTFGGTFFFTTRERDGADALIRITSSSYGKGIYVFHPQGGEFLLAWTRQFEDGLEEIGITLQPFSDTAHLYGDSRTSLLVSLTTSYPGGDSIYSYDLATGSEHLVARDAILVAVASRKDEAVKLVVIYRRSSIATLDANGFVIDERPGRFALQEQTRTPDGIYVGTFDGAVERYDVSAAGKFVLRWRVVAGVNVSSSLSRSVDQRSVAVHGERGSVWIDDGAAVGKPLQRTVLRMPLAADLDGDGVNEIVVATADRRLAVLTFAGGQLRERWSFAGVESGTSDGFGHPMIVENRDGRAEGIAALSSIYGGATLYYLLPDGTLKWRFSLPLNRWEFLVTWADFNSDGVSDLFVKDSHEYRALDGRNGSILWSGFESSECQRSAVVVDGDGDEVADVMFRSSTKLVVVSGRDGTVIRRMHEAVAYGGHLAPFGRASVVTFGSGAMSIATSDLRTVTTAQQQQTRGLESLAPVVADADFDGVTEAIQVGGDGYMRIFDDGGRLLRERALTSEAAWPAVGIVSREGRQTMILLGTPDGKLIAESLDPETPGWSVNFDGEVASPIVADLDRDGEAEIVVCAGDGYLHVLRTSSRRHRPVSRGEGAAELFALAPPQVLLNRTVGNWLLLGYDIDESRAAAGAVTNMTLHWIVPPRSTVANDTLRRLSDLRWTESFPVQSLLGDGTFERPLSDEWHNIYSGGREAWRVGEGRPSRGNAGVLDGSISPYSSFAFTAPASRDHYYLQSVWARADRGANIYVGVQWLPSGAVTFLNSDWSVSTWTQLTDLVLAREDANEADFWLINFNAAGDAYFDDALFVDLGAFDPDHCTIAANGLLDCASPLGR